MSISSFKLSKPLEARRDEATRIIEKDPHKIPVIVEKIRESDVPDINEHMYSVSAKQRIGQFVAEFHTKLKLGADKTIFLFVKNTVIPNGKGFGSNEYALMSEIYEEHKDEDGFLYMSYSGEDILSATKTSLIIADSILHEHPNGHTLLESLPLTWKPLLSTLEKLVSISGSNEKMKKRFEQIIKQWKEIFCRLLICFSEKGDIPWLMKLKEFTTFDVRKHLVEILFPRAIPQTEEDLEDVYFPVEVIRETLFQDSFDQIMAVNKWDFSAGISVEFLDEEAQGFGVLREWFSLVCKHLFEPENHLFIGCPDDPRRFSPDPHPFRFEENYLQKYRFAGRIIALALKHEVQVVFLFEPLFFHYLCGKQCFSWRDLIHTDLELHTQFKQMLEMDAEEFDAMDGFGLTFEGFSLNDDKKKVTSENREQYVQCRMDQRYNHHISDQITHFRFGVEDIIDGVYAESLFGSLKLEDLDSMLRGLEDDYINVLEWMEVTVYDNYQPTDNVVMCFWRVVCQMNQEQLHNLLCFWTAHRFLPRDGFHGLPRFCISRMYTGEDPTLKNKYKPTSHTCFYSLQLPDYDTYEDTEAALRYITQEYCGFGVV